MEGKLSLLALIVVVAVGSTSAAVLWPEFRVKYDLNAFGGFHKMGRTLEDALKDNGFVSIDQGSCISNHGDVTFYGFRVKDPVDKVLSLLFDRNGVIAGIQAWFDQAEILVAPENPFRYDLLPIYQNVTEGNTTYFVSTAYFVHPDTICEEGRTEEDLINNGTGTGIWLQQGPKPSNVDEIPHQRSDAIAIGWSKNSCFPGMGRHNFFRVETYDHMEPPCSESEGIFLLYNNNDQLTGFGFHIQGVAVSDYVEYPPNLAISAILGSPVPACVLEQNTLFGTTTMHVYFNANPWQALCPL